MVDQLTHDLIQLIETLPPLSVYLIFFGIAYGENIIPPIPGDLLVAFGGYLAAEAVVGISLLLVVTTVASVVGFMSLYWVGSKWGGQIEHQKSGVRVLRFIPVEYLNKVRAWMKRWGLGVVLANHAQAPPLHPCPYLVKVLNRYKPKHPNSTFLMLNLSAPLAANPVQTHKPNN